jgi:hypothetical protein
MATALELICPHNVTQIPHWFYNLDNQIDYYKVGVTTYVVLMQWFHDNSPPDYIQHLANTPPDTGHAWPMRWSSRSLMFFLVTSNVLPETIWPISTQTSATTNEYALFTQIVLQSALSEFGCVCVFWASGSKGSLVITRYQSLPHTPGKVLPVCVTQ